MKSKKKSQRKWESLHYQSPEKYSYSKKEKEYLSKYRKIAGEYLEDWELIELFKKNNFDDDLITKELNKIILGDDYKWKEIKNGKPVTTRSTDQVRKRQKYYKADKAYMKYEKTEGDNESNNKRKIKGSFHKNLNDFYHYVSKKPKRPFQKCIEVPSDYLPLKNNNNIQENQNIINTDDNINNNDDINNNNNNKIIASKSANNIIKIDNEKNKINELGNNININNDNKKAIKKALPINMNINNKMEETKNNESDKIISDEEQRKIILIKGEVFKNLKRIKTNTETKFKENKNRQKEIYKQKDSSEKRIQTSSGIDSDYSLSNKDIKNDKALQKKYLKIFFGNMNHYSKKIENNIKRASSKDSETSDDRPETIKRNINNNKRNNIPTSSNILQKKIRSMNISSSNNKNNMNNNINKNLRRAYELDQRDQEIRFESKVVNLTINSCYDNPYRDQYLKFINEKRKKNPGKIVELIIPQYNNMFIPPFPFQYQYNPYLNQNMFMYQSPIPMNNQNLNSQNKQNMNNVESIHNSMNIHQYQPLSNLSMNSQFNSQMTPLNNNNSFGVNKETNSDNQINNNMNDN